MIREHADRPDGIRHGIPVPATMRPKHRAIDSHGARHCLPGINPRE
jgi:hypothetical protein